METGPNPKDDNRDDALLTTLLDSACSLQQYHDRIRSKVPAKKFDETMADVINTQSLIRSRHLDSETAMHLVLNRAQKLAAAAGGAIVLLDNESLEYKVGTGLGTILLGLRIPANSCSFFEQLRKEPMVESYAFEDAALRLRLLARVLSLPIYRRGKLAGCLQLFSRSGPFNAQGLHACEMMSAIVSNTISESASLSDGALAKAIVRGKDKGGHAESPVPSLGVDQGLQNVHRGKNEPRKAQQSVTTRSGQDEFEDIPDFEDLIRELQETDTFRREVAQREQAPEPLLRLPFVAASGGQTSALGSNTAEMHGSAQAEVSASEILPASTDLPQGTPPSGEAIEVNPENRMPEKKLWQRLKSLVYPTFILIFAIAVRIKAGAQSWPLEILVYLLLVLTTLEIHQRLKKN